VLRGAIKPVGAHREGSQPELVQSLQPRLPSPDKAQERASPHLRHPEISEIGGQCKGDILITQTLDQ
jgi:hypothetical protein